MRARFIHLLALGSFAVALAVVTQQTPANQPAAPAAAQPPAKEPAAGIKIAPSKVTAVTVYPNAALVTREVEVAGNAGRVELVVSPLPPAAIPSSLHAEGAEGIRVLTTRYRTRPIVEDTRADVRKVTDEIKQLQLAREKIEGDLLAVQDNMKMLGKMEGFLGVTTIQATEKGALNAEQAIALAKHIRESRTEGSKELVNLKQQVQANQEKAAEAQRRVGELTAGVARYEHDAVIVVEKADPAVGKIRLNYLVDKAAWHPQYKLRADKAVKDQVTLEYLAGVVQNTGEDWRTRIVLSTQPMERDAARSANLYVTAGPKAAAIAELEEQIRACVWRRRPTRKLRRHRSREHRGARGSASNCSTLGCGQTRLHAQLPRRANGDARVASVLQPQAR